MGIFNIEIKKILENVNRVHPKMIDGQDIISQHYPPTKVELESWFKKPGGPQ
jgi:hypothetical protein